MANQNAPHDDNYVPTALFAVSSAPTTVAPGRIDQVTGRVLVDLGGNTGTSVEIPTGTVNGVNTVFTVTNLPIWMEVSGQTMVSQTTDPTNYGYSVTGTGPYTITFLNPPATTQTPHSFHN